VHRFDYHAPESLEQALALLAQHGGKARVVAGGTDLVIRMKRGDWVPPVVVNVKRIPGLRGIERRENDIWIGALTTIADVIDSELIAEALPILAETAPTMASAQIRNLATVGGNLCNAAPSADMAPPMLVLDAQLRAVGPTGTRTLCLHDLFLGPGETALGPDEMVTGILVPLEEGWRSGYRKLEHREAMDTSVAGVAAAVKPAGSEEGAPVWEDVRVALGAVAPIPFRSAKVEEELRGKAATAERIERAAELAAAESRPISDLRGPAWYRRHLIRVLSRRLLTELAAEVSP
jgi:carbon-monoxide dehydrogenase medium subunit